MVQRQYRQLNVLLLHDSAASLHLTGQVDKTRDLTTATKAEASKVEGQARELNNLAKGAAQASERQQEAFVQAKAKAKDAEKAGEQAKIAFRCVCSCVSKEKSRNCAS